VLRLHAEGVTVSGPLDIIDSLVGWLIGWLPKKPATPEPKKPLTPHDLHWVGEDPVTPVQKQDKP
jgi:hypothetical protein